ncbi:histone-lysine N-methyltransferase SETMAR-like isoform X1 [Polistes fuscatus]|uniref:histone-lysine N-methyltransferase SETMAR-like isoform X1 n=1 Tax=Polistes fuscatus TaxID=30207 RepID=UPI001CA939DD|nr:histone-lysine N-methyltransferase SETMAR-like isoform X1 [Polistes fuscatus]
MSENKEEIRYILKFYYKKGKNATQAAKRICDVYGHDAVSVRVAQSWFKRFQSGNVDVKDAPRSGRPITEKVDEILEKVEQDRHISSHDIGKELNIDHKTVLNHLEKAGYKKKLDVWVPYNLTIKNLMDRIFICESLLKRNEIEPFLKRLITGDEKWITLQQSESSKTMIKSEFTSSKVMLCVWWDWKDKVHQAIEIKRPELINSEGIVFHHDNARSYTSLETHQKLRGLGWEVLMHPPYSPDLAPSDYHLFRPLQSSLNGVKLTSKEACENQLLQFFAQKSQQFYTDGIMILPQKWQKVIDQNGIYLV